MSRIRAGCRSVAGLLVAGVVLAGCTAVTSGTAQRAAGGPAPGTVDVALLDPGNYPTTPRKPLGVAGSATAGALLDAQRMADFVAGPWEADPTLITASPFGFSPGAMPIMRDPTLLGVISPAVGAAGARNNYLYGFATARHGPFARPVFNLVLRMASPADAVAATRDMVQALRDTPQPLTTGMASVPVPGHLDTAGVGRTPTDDPTRNIVDAFTAHGPYVLVQHIEVDGTLEGGAALAGKLIDVQAPRIDGFTATDPGAFADLPRDPAGLLALSLPTPKGTANVNNNATFAPAGALHYQINPIQARTQFRDASVDAVALTVGSVYRTRDPAAAAVLSAQFADEVTTQGTATDGPPNLPGSRCMKYAGNSGFYCTASAGRYAFEITSAQLKDVHQKTAAQYMLLAAS